MPLKNYRWHFYKIGYLRSSAFRPARSASAEMAVSSSSPIVPFKRTVATSLERRMELSLEDRNSAAVNTTERQGKCKASDILYGIFGSARYTNPENISEELTTAPGILQTPGVRTLLNYVPLNSKHFYLLMIRDYLCKKISYPFFLVCHGMIVLDSGWEKLHFITYVEPLVKFLHIFIPRRKNDERTNFFFPD